MIAHIHFGKNFTRVVNGSQWRRVECERCRTAYFYLLSRAGVGHGEAPYYVGQKSAERRAATAAERSLAERLAHDVELVPCPKCKWVNESLVDQYRRRRYRGWRMGIGLLLLGGPVAALITFILMQEDGGRPPPSHALPIAVAVCGGCLALAALVASFRHWLRLRIDPNRDHPGPHELPPGTPPALLLRPSIGATPAMLEPALTARAAVNDGEPAAGWAVLRAGQSPFLEVCCACMADADRVFSLPFSEGAQPRAPLCGACLGMLRRLWWQLAVMAFVATAIIVGTVTWLLPGVDDTGRMMIFTTFTVLCGITAVAVIPGRICRPFRLRTIDGERSVRRFAAHHPEYTRQLIECHRPRAIPAPAELLRDPDQSTAIPRSRIPL